jgi:hypothetical protein
MSERDYDCQNKAPQSEDAESRNENQQQRQQPEQVKVDKVPHPDSLDESWCENISGSNDQRFTTPTNNTVIKDQNISTNVEQSEIVPDERDSSDAHSYHGPSTQQSCVDTQGLLFPHDSQAGGLNCKDTTRNRDHNSNTAQCDVDLDEESQTIGEDTRHGLNPTTKRLESVETKEKNAVDDLQPKDNTRINYQIPGTRIVQCEIVLDEGDSPGEDTENDSDAISIIDDIPSSTTEDQKVAVSSNEDPLMAKLKFSQQERDSSSASDSSIFELASSDPLCPGDDGINAHHESDSVASSILENEATIIVSNIDPFYCREKPAESLSNIDSDADLTYSMGVISKLRQRTCSSEDESTFDNIDETTPSKDHNKKANLPPRPPPVFYFWTYLTEEVLHAAILRCLVALSKHASRNPYKYIGASIFLSFALAGVGFLTNFTVILDHEEIFTPMNSLPKAHGEWIYEKAGFDDTSDFTIIIHSDGQNIAHVDAMRRTFEALDTLRSTPGYEELCATSSYLNLKGDPDCWIWSTTQFWNHDLEKFEAEIATDEQLVITISQETFPDGTPVYQVCGRFKA